MWDMLQGLITALSNGLQQMYAAICGFFSWTRDHLGLVIISLLGPLGYLGYQAYRYLAFGEGVREQAENMLRSLGLVGPQIEGLQWLININYVLPVDHAIVALGIGAGLLLGISIFRFVRFIIW